MKKSYSLIMILGVLILFGVGTLPQAAEAYSGNSNIIAGLSPNECTVMSNPQTTIDFSQVMVTNGVYGNQWSAQNNYYLHSNVLPSGFSEN